MELNRWKMTIIEPLQDSMKSQHVPDKESVDVSSGWKNSLKDWQDRSLDKESRCRQWKIEKNTNNQQLRGLDQSARSDGVEETGVKRFWGGEENDETEKCDSPKDFDQDRRCRNQDDHEKSPMDSLSSDGEKLHFNDTKMTANLSKFEMPDKEKNEERPVGQIGGADERENNLAASIEEDKSGWVGKDAINVFSKTLREALPETSVEDELGNIYDKGLQKHMSNLLNSFIDDPRSLDGVIPDNRMRSLVNKMITVIPKHLAEGLVRRETRDIVSYLHCIAQGQGKQKNWAQFKEKTEFESNDKISEKYGEMEDMKADTSFRAKGLDIDPEKDDAGESELEHKEGDANDMTAEEHGSGECDFDMVDDLLSCKEQNMSDMPEKDVEGESKREAKSQHLDREQSGQEEITGVHDEIIEQMNGDDDEEDETVPLPLDLEDIDEEENTVADGFTEKDPLGDEEKLLMDFDEAQEVKKPADDDDTSKDLDNTNKNSMPEGPFKHQNPVLPLDLEDNDKAEKATTVSDDLAEKVLLEHEKELHKDPDERENVAKPAADDTSKAPENTNENSTPITEDPSKYQHPVDLGSLAESGTEQGFGKPTPHHRRRDLSPSVVTAVLVKAAEQEKPASQMKEARLVKRVQAKQKGSQIQKKKAKGSVVDRQILKKSGSKFISPKRIGKQKRRARMPGQSLASLIIEGDLESKFKGRKIDIRTVKYRTKCCMESSGQGGGNSMSSNSKKNMGSDGSSGSNAKQNDSSDDDSQDRNKEQEQNNNNEQRPDGSQPQPTVAQVEAKIPPMNYKSVRKKHSSVSDSDLFYLLGSLQPDTSPTVPGVSPILVDLNQCILILLHTLSCDVDNKCSPCVFLDALHNHFASCQLPYKRCPQCWQLFLVNLFHVKQCLEEEHQDRESSSDVCHEIMKTAEFRVDVILGCGEALWQKMKKYIGKVYQKPGLQGMGSLGMYSITENEIVESSPSEGAISAFGLASESSTCATEGVDKVPLEMGEFEASDSEAPSASGIAVSGTHRNSVNISMTPSVGSSLTRSGSFKQHYQPSLSSIPERPVRGSFKRSSLRNQRGPKRIEEDEELKKPAEQAGELGSQDRQFSLQSFRTDASKESEDASFASGGQADDASEGTTLDYIYAHYKPLMDEHGDNIFPEAGAVANQDPYETQGKTYGTTGVMSLPVGFNFRTQQDQLLSLETKPTGEPGIGEVVYGTRRQIMKIARYWAMIRNTIDKEEYKYQLREEGVILGDAKRNLKILKTRYQKKAQWIRLVHLGNGVAGKCHMARDLTSQFNFCVKRIHIAKYEENELVTWSDLDHPNIVKLYGAIRKGQKIYIFCEFIDGGSLTSVIIEQKGLNRRLSHWMCMRYFEQLLKVLVYLKSKNILHEDLKADNILVKRNTTLIAVTDFGLSKRLNADTEMEGMMPTGSQTQWSPEKAKSSGHGFAADVWAAICVLVHMFSAFPPWSKRFPGFNLIYVIVTQSPPLADIPANIQESVRDIITNGFNSDPKQRPTAEELLRHNAFKILEAVASQAHDIVSDSTEEERATDQSVRNTYYSTLQNSGQAIPENILDSSQGADEMQEILSSLSRMRMSSESQQPQSQEEEEDSQVPNYTVMMMTEIELNDPVAAVAALTGTTSPGGSMPNATVPVDPPSTAQAASAQTSQLLTGSAGAGGIGSGSTSAQNCDASSQSTPAQNCCASCGSRSAQMGDVSESTTAQTNSIPGGSANDEFEEETIYWPPEDASYELRESPYHVSSTPRQEDAGLEYVDVCDLPTVLNSYVDYDFNENSSSGESGDQDTHIRRFISDKVPEGQFYLQTVPLKPYEPQGRSDTNESLVNNLPKFSSLLEPADYCIYFDESNNLSDETDFSNQETNRQPESPAQPVSSPTVVRRRSASQESLTTSMSPRQSILKDIREISSDIITSQHQVHLSQSPELHAAAATNQTATEGQTEVAASRTAVSRMERTLSALPLLASFSGDALGNPDPELQVNPDPQNQWPSAQQGQTPRAHGEMAARPDVSDGTSGQNMISNRNSRSSQPSSMDPFPTSYYPNSLLFDPDREYGRCDSDDIFGDGKEETNGATAAPIPATSANSPGDTLNATQGLSDRHEHNAGIVSRARNFTSTRWAHAEGNFQAFSSTEPSTWPTVINNPIYVIPKDRSSSQSRLGRTEGYPFETGNNRRKFSPKQKSVQIVELPPEGTLADRKNPGLTLNTNLTLQIPVLKGNQSAPAEASAKMVSPPRGPSTCPESLNLSSRTQRPEVGTRMGLSLPYTVNSNRPMGDNSGKNWGSPESRGRVSSFERTPSTPRSQFEQQEEDFNRLERDSDISSQEPAQFYLEGDEDESAVATTDSGDDNLKKIQKLLGSDTLDMGHKLRLLNDSLEIILEIRMNQHYEGWLDIADTIRAGLKVKGFNHYTLQHVDSGDSVDYNGLLARTDITVKVVDIGDNSDNCWCEEHEYMLRAMA